jgi:hypothetical protein
MTVSVGAVVEWNAYGHHRAVVLAVAPSGALIIACTSVARDLPSVAVSPRTLESRSLGWSDDDTRTSHFYPSGLHVVAAGDVAPVRVRLPTGSLGSARRAAPSLVLRLRGTVEAWVREGVVTDADIIARLDPPTPSTGSS